MSKYEYDKSVLKGLSVGPFLHEVDEREKHIEAADTSAPKSIYNSNILASKLHPDFLCLKVSSVIDHGVAKEYKLIPDKEFGTEELAYFRAGQYLSVFAEIGDIQTARPFTICSSPKDSISQNPFYKLVVKPVEGGLVTNHLYNTWNEGTKVLTSAPLGHFYYTSLRDARHVIALAGGSGITPFYSMASAIVDGIEDFNLTILYGSRTEKDIILKDSLKELASKSNGKVKLINILSDENNDLYEHGFIDAEFIKKFIETDDYSVFACGPDAMMEFLKPEISKLGLPFRRYRKEVAGEIVDSSKYKNLSNLSHSAHKLTIRSFDKTWKIEAFENITILRNIENAGIFVPADCRGGSCGWCRSRLISGKVFVARDNRRLADDKFGWIHPCCTFPKSDIEIEIYTNDYKN